VPDETQKSYLLIVDDDRNLTETLSSFVDYELSIATQTAGDGIEALEAIERQKPALILLDLHMPRMDGFQFLAELNTRPEYASLPVIILTAQQPSPEARLRLPGVVFMIQKDSDILQKLREVLSIYVNRLPLLG